MGLKNICLVRFELNYFENVILCSRDTAVTYNPSDVSTGYDAIFDKPYATPISELYAGTVSLPQSKVRSMERQYFLF